MSEPVAPASSQPSGGAVRRWVWPLLIVSLAINLLVAGALIGAFAGKRHGHEWRRGGSLVSLVRFAETLPAERREPIARLAQEARQKLRQAWLNSRTSQRAAREALTAEPFDRQKLADLLSAVASERAEAHRVAAQALSEAAAMMSAEERAAFAALQDRRRKGRWRDGE